jgi:lipopolysaccharide export system protein LptC
LPNNALARFPAFLHSPLHSILNARWYDRIAAVISVSLLAVLAAVSFYLAEKARRQDTMPVARAVSSEPDYFIEGFAATKTTPDGTPSYRLTAKIAKHRPDTDGFDLMNPVAVSLNPLSARMITRANTGVTTGGKDRTELSGNVRMVRIDPKTGERLVIETEKAVLLTSQDRASSDERVVITREGSILTGKGMLFDNNTHELKVFEDVRLTIVPRDPTRTMQAR